MHLRKKETRLKSGKIDLDEKKPLKKEATLTRNKSDVNLVVSYS